MKKKKKSAVQFSTSGNFTYIITIRWTIRIQNEHSTWVALNIDSFRLNLHMVIRCETFFLISSLKESSIFTLDSPKLPEIRRNAWIAWTYGRLSLAVIENKFTSSKRFTNIFINFHHLIFKAFQQITTIPSFLVHSSHIFFFKSWSLFQFAVKYGSNCTACIEKVQNFLDWSSFRRFIESVFISVFQINDFLKVVFGSFLICD